MILSARLFAVSLAFAAAALTAAPSHAEQKVRRNFEVEWETIEGASSYEIKLARKDDSKKKPTLIKTKETKWSATIKPGIYIMQLRSFDDRGAPGDWSPGTELQVKLPSVVQGEPKPGMVINADDEDHQDVKLKWEEVPGAEKYKVSVRATDGSWQTEKETGDTDLSVSVPVGQALEWNVTALDPKGEIGDANTFAVPFEVKGPPLAKPKIEKPLSKYVREIGWSQSPHAKGYAYELSYRNPKSGKWEKVEAKSETAENKLPWTISRPSGKYRLKVQAHADHRAPSKTMMLDFETRGGFRDPAALETAILRDSMVKPTNYYAIASYLYTSIDYAAVSYEENNSSHFTASGGTGRLGIGYQDPEANWGGFAIVDLSGFTIGGQTFTFTSVEAHATRKLEFGQGGLLLFGTGLFSKELPAVKGNQLDKFGGLGTLRTFGPHAGFTYWLPLSQRFGAQLNARVYETAFGTAYNHGAVQFSTSYQYGLLGTYRLAPAWMGYAGYAYRKDSALYNAKSGTNSFASDGQTNSIDLQGHYLNLLLEFSF